MRMPRMGCMGILAPTGKLGRCSLFIIRHVLRMRLAVGGSRFVCATELDCHAPGLPRAAGSRRAAFFSKSRACYSTSYVN